MLYASKYLSPIGTLGLFSSETQLKQITLPTQSHSPGFIHDLELKEIPILLRCAEQLEEYFMGTRKKFTLPIKPEGTPFQVATWMSLRSIKYGKTVTYGQQAKIIGNPNGARAVGSANALNPLPIVLPCHRVIGSDGKLRGYAGGLDLLYIKKYLLNHEQSNLSY